MGDNKELGFSMDEYNKFLKTIKCGSPVHKINFTLENPNAVAGMYLITMKDPKAYLEKFADKSGINNDTLFVFESRHVVECCQIIYGCLNVLKNIGIYKSEYKKFIDNIIDITLAKPSFSINFTTKLTSLVLKYIGDGSENVLIARDNFLYIVNNIWYVPYGQIDEIAKEAIEEFKKHCRDGENNE